MKTQRNELRKARFSASEMKLVDRARGDVSPGIWVREAALLAVRKPPPMAWPAEELRSFEGHGIEVGFRLTPKQLVAIGQAAGGFPVGLWVREVAVRVAVALLQCDPDLYSVDFEFEAGLARTKTWSRTRAAAEATDGSSDGLFLDSLLVPEPL